jgi:acyl-CoA reductase-like NAD-dependent aldehyde dehydrogenase
MSTERNIPAVDAMLDVHYVPGIPRREINNHELTPQQYDEYAKMAGEFARQKLERVNFSGKVWQGLADESRIKFFKKTFDQARENARTLMKRRYRDLAKKAGT